MMGLELLTTHLECAKRPWQLIVVIVAKVSFLELAQVWLRSCLRESSYEKLAPKLAPDDLRMSLRIPFVPSNWFWAPLKYCEN